MLKKTVLLVLILGTFLSCSVLFDSYKSEIDGVYIPKNLKDALSEVNKFYSDSLKGEIRKMKEADYVGEYHFTTGLWMRNNWSLWKGSRLHRYFRQKGIKDPDGMSGVILTSYHRQLNGKDIALKEQVAGYKEYWKGSRKMYNLAKLPRKSRHPADSLEFGYLMWYNTRVKTSILHLQTNSRSDSLWIYDHIHGWKKIESEIAEKLKAKDTYKTDSLLQIVYKK